MKKYQSLAVLLFLFCFSSLAFGQVVADTVRTASFTAANQFRTITVEGRQSVGFVLSGTWSATIRVDLSSDNGATWETSVDIYDVSAKTFSTSVTANGTYTIANVGGMSHARLFVSSYTSGTVLVALRSSVGVSAIQVGPSGSVTVVQTTHDNLNANANLQVGDADASTSNLVPVGGAAADGAAETGNPVLIAGQDGTNAQSIATDSNGQINVAFLRIGPSDNHANSSATLSTTVHGADGRPLAVFSSLFNGSTWDRERNNEEVTLLASAARTAQTDSTDQVNYNAKGVMIILDITVDAASVGLTPSILMKDPVSGKDVTIWTAAAAATLVGTDIYLIYPGVLAADFNGTEAVSIALPRTWVLRIAVADADEATYSVGASYIQ